MEGYEIQRFKCGGCGEVVKVAANTPLEQVTLEECPECGLPFARCYPDE